MTIMRTRVFWLAYLLILLTLRQASAHHSFAAEYDAAKPVTISGTITKVDWINPHAWLHIEAKGSDGSVVEWMVEMGTPNVLVRRGFTKKSLAPGAEVIVQGYLAKDGTKKANGGNVTFADGTKLFVGGSAPSEVPQK